MSAQQTLPAPVEGGEDDNTTVEGREGTSIPGDGGDDASDSDDDFEVTWESTHLRLLETLALPPMPPVGNRRRQSRLEVR